MTIAPAGRSDPIVLRIAAADVAEALVRGLRDFQAQPLFGLLFGALYAAGGILIVLSVTAFGAALSGLSARGWLCAAWSVRRHWPL